MRKKIVAGNWKMKLTRSEANELIGELATLLSDDSQITQAVQVIVCPSFLHISDVNTRISASKLPIDLGAQNCSQFSVGAFTGEVAAVTLPEYNVNYVLIGHSERRENFRETPAILHAKIEQALAADLKVIFCCGESLEDRTQNQQESVIDHQIQNSLAALSVAEMKQITIAYEPIWAIGTGRTATAEDAQNMHAFIRERLGEYFDTQTAENTRILYGGSCNANNARELFQAQDIDGGLIGTASLKAKSFYQIIQAGASA